MIPDSVSIRLAALRQLMAQKNIDMYLVLSSDFHESEYVGDYFKTREYITGFTGSAGTAVITMTEAGLWTDGRYFVQAKKQLSDEFTLYRMGEEDVPTVDEYVEQNLKEQGCLAFDGRVVNSRHGRTLKEIVEKKQGTLVTGEDLIDIIWNDRPLFSNEPIWILEKKYSGQSTADKLCGVREKMKEQKADVYLLSSLCDIAWLLNVRGNDISYVPVVLSYLVLTGEECIWFVQQEALDTKVRVYLEENHILVKEYNEFYNYVKELENRTILFDSEVMNYRICSSIADSNRIVEAAELTARLKAVKNETEIFNIRNAHVKDAVAMCRFMYWLKTNVGKISMTELSVSDYLQKLRKEQEDFLELSFATISAYKEHGAIVHYEPTEKTDFMLKAEGFLLVDSGGHYLQGTTDITRTFALGDLTEEMKADYTLVCRACLNLAAAKFLHGRTGDQMDYAAREPFWEAGLNYRHGTGHGVGYLLNVHEGPNSFSSKEPLEAGMVTTDEPGIYKEGKYGIRLENELLCMQGEKNEYGQFMYFETLTFVPFDLDAIVKERMTEVEIKRLNDYHAQVYEKISPFLAGEELAWLKNATRNI